MAKHPSDPLYYKRAFLNKEGYHTSAYVLATVHREYGNHTLTLADCSRPITLEFSMSGADEQRNSLHKAQLLARVTAEFADALRQYIEEDKQRHRQLAAARRARGLS